jgi:hypothetical protein
MGPAPAKHAPAIVNVLAVSFLEFMQCHLRGSGGPATCKTVARRDCAPHTVMRAGRPRTRHARGSIMLHFAIKDAPRASCLLPHPLSPHPLATAFAAGTHAAPLRPSTLSSHVQRATFNLQPLALLASHLARDCATKPSMDRKPVSPRSAVRRPPM